MVGSRSHWLTQVQQFANVDSGLVFLAYQFRSAQQITLESRAQVSLAWFIFENKA